MPDVWTWGAFTAGRWRPDVPQLTREPHGPRSSRRAAATAALGAAVGLFASLAPPALGATAPSSAEPLPAADYSVRAACQRPGPAEAGCLALQLIPVTNAAVARTHPVAMVKRRAIRSASAAEGAYGLRPADLHAAYAIPKEAPATETIGIVDAYNDPTAEADLRVYDEEFGLPACTHANGCFTKVGQTGSTSSLPATDGGWAVEISLDIETAHAVCQNCRILLVESNSAEYTDLEAAEERAVTMGAAAISNSWGGPEPGSESGAFNHPGVVIAAASGDFGYLNWDVPAEEEWARGYADYPAASPNVVAVGGTRLALKEGTNEWKEESVWNDGAPTGGHGAAGGGCSERFTAQPWQRSVSDWLEIGCGTDRAVADVAADADPYSGVAVYDSTPEVSGHSAPKWTTVGGTSLASPIIASTFALAGGANGVSYPASTLYAHLGSGSFHDVTSGSNGECTKAFNANAGHSGCTTAEERASCPSKLICLAAPGYDGPTGVGTPNALGGFIPPRPTVTAVTPDEGGTDGGRSVRITGTYLEGASVDFGANAASEVTVESATELRVQSPAAAAAGTVDVTVTTAGGTSATSAADQFTYYIPQPPTVSSVTPSQGSIAGGTTVTVTGTNLEGASVQFGAIPASEVTVKSPTELTAKSPANLAGTVDITIMTAGGTSEQAEADQFTYYIPPPPTVTAVTPGEGSTAGGTRVTITGEHLAAATAVDFEGTAATIVSDTAGSITVDTPAHAAGAVNVSVTTVGGESEPSSAAHFTYHQPPKGSNGLEGSSGEGGGTGGSGSTSVETTTTTATVATTAATGGAFKLIGKPTVNSRTGAITFRVSVPEAGTLTWLLSFRNGVNGVYAARHGQIRCNGRQVAFGNRCWPARVVYGQGAKTVAESSATSITVLPTGPARRALSRLLKRGRGLSVAALFDYHAPGSATTQAPTTVSVRLRRARSAGGTHTVRAIQNGVAHALLAPLSSLVAF